MSIQSVEDFACGTWMNRSVVARAVDTELTTDTGLLLFGQFDDKLGWYPLTASKGRGLAD